MIPKKSLRTNKSEHWKGSWRHSKIKGSGVPGTVTCTSMSMSTHVGEEYCMMCILCSRDVVTSERTRERESIRPLLLLFAFTPIPNSHIPAAQEPRTGHRTAAPPSLTRPLIHNVGACSSSSVLLRSGVHVSYGLCKSKWSHNAWHGCACRHQRHPF